MLRWTLLCLAILVALGLGQAFAAVTPP